jgi:hypothetical protein
VTTQAGVWIDHRQAVIVTISDKGEAAKRIESDVDKHVRYSGSAGSGGSHGAGEGGGEYKRERRFEDQLAKYYKDVIACMRDAESILIFGPGEAKGQLKTCLEHDGLGARVVEVDTVDKMTDRQIAAKVRERFPH